MSSIWTIRRSPTDTKVSGLCGGVAEHWGVDPVLVRVGWVLLALSGGVGLVLYAAGWLLVPVGDRTAAPLDDLLGADGRRWPREVWVTLVVVACLAAFAVFGSVSPFGVGPAVILAVIWYFGFFRRRDAAPDGAGTPAGFSAPPPEFVRHTGPVTPFTAAAAAWRDRIEEQSRRAAAPDPGTSAHAAFLAQPDPVGLYGSAEPAAAPAPAAPAPRSGPADRLAARRLRLGTLALLGLVLSGLALADAQGVAVPAAGYWSAALAVVGLALVAATWWGRPRGLLPVGLLLVPVVVAAAVLGPVTHLDQWARTTRSYTAVGDLPAAGDDQRAGELVVDLSGLPSGDDLSYTAHLGTGRLEVVVPPGTEVTADYRVGIGEVLLDGRQVGAGSQLTGRVPLAMTPLLDPGPSTSSLTLHLSVDQGQLEVRR